MPKGTERVPSQAHFGDDKVPVEDMPVAGMYTEPPQTEAMGQTTLVETRGLINAAIKPKFDTERMEREGYGGEAE